MTGRIICELSATTASRGGAEAEAEGTVEDEENVEAAGTRWSLEETQWGWDRQMGSGLQNA